MQREGSGGNINAAKFDGALIAFSIFGERGKLNRDKNLRRGFNYGAFPRWKNGVRPFDAREFAPHFDACNETRKATRCNYNGYSFLKSQRRLIDSRLPTRRAPGCGAVHSSETVAYSLMHFSAGGKIYRGSLGVDGRILPSRLLS